jgi:hypothetical protein
VGQLAKVAVQLAKHPVTGQTTGEDWATPYMRTAESLRLSIFRKKLDKNLPATRGMVIQTLLEVLRIPLRESVLPYVDVPEGSLYAKAVATATRLGIVHGDEGAHTFRPNAPVNRAEAATMIMLALRAKE